MPSAIVFLRPLGLRLLAAACLTLARNCVAGISANRALLYQRVQKSAGLATALNPYIGYENATRVAREALLTGKSVADLVLEWGLMDQAQLEAVLEPEILTRPHKLRGH